MSFSFLWCKNSFMNLVLHDFRHSLQRMPCFWRWILCMSLYDCQSFCKLLFPSSASSLLSAQWKRGICNTRGVCDSKQDESILLVYYFVPSLDFFHFLSTFLRDFLFLLPQSSFGEFFSLFLVNPFLSHSRIGLDLLMHQKLFYSVIFR